MLLGFVPLPNLRAWHQAGSGGFCRRNNEYSEESADRQSVLCDKHNDDTGAPHGPDL